MRVRGVKARRFAVHPRRVSSSAALILALSLMASSAACSSQSSNASSHRPRDTTPTSTNAAATSTTQTSSLAPHPEGREGVPAFAHVFIVLMENLSEEAALSAPSIAQLAHHFAFAASYYAVSHPSLPNYLALVSGSTWGISSDCTSCHVSGSNLASQLDAADISWGAYFQAMPAPCFSGPEADGGLYAQKHNPFIYFDDVRTKPELCNHLQPLSSLIPLLSQGASQVPRFVWVTPDMCDDGHDCSPATAGSWLSNFVSTVAASAAWQGGGVMFIVWDEGTDDSAVDPASGAVLPGGGGGHILGIVVAPGVQQGKVVNVPYNHYSLLRTVEDSFGLPLLGEAAAPGVRPLSAFWSNDAGSPGAG